MKIEVGGPHEFDRPSSKDEALDRMEQVTGPQGRAPLEGILEQIGKAEAKFLAENGNGE